MDSTTRVWRAYFASEDDLRTSISQLRVDGVEQNLLTAIILTGEAGQGDLAGTIVCKLTMDDLAKRCGRSDRTLRRRQSIEQLSPWVDRVSREGTTDDLVVYPDRMDRPVRQEVTDGNALSREIDSHQRDQRRKKRKKRPATSQPQLAPLKNEQQGIVVKIMTTIAAFIGRSRELEPGLFWPGPNLPPLPQPSTSGHVRPDTPDIRTPLYIYTYNYIYISPSPKQKSKHIYI